MYEITQDHQYMLEVEGYMKGWLPGGQVQYTQCGLAWRDMWGANRYAGQWEQRLAIPRFKKIDMSSLRTQHDRSQ